jgi:hypothetical protein
MTVGFTTVKKEDGSSQVFLLSMMTLFYGIPQFEQKYPKKE